MKKAFLILTLVCVLMITGGVLAQDTTRVVSDTLTLNGQVSIWANYSIENNMPLQLGGRYIPTLNYGIKFSDKGMLDFEGAANIYGSLSTHPFDSLFADGAVTPYRAWARFSTSQFEIRAGLQKIDFGSATLLRPLQWFNQIDPRDPLALTNGVYGILGRYYFLNNANIWVWALYGNEKIRGFDAIKTCSKQPEYGARVQYPTPHGEIAVSFHHRTIDVGGLSLSNDHSLIPENRIGIDGKWDFSIGLWLEASYIRKTKDIGMFTHQTLLNIGADYTFGIGNGLHLVAEHLMLSGDKKPFRYNNNLHVTASVLTYPFGLFDKLSSIVYYSCDLNTVSLFLNY